MAIPRRPENAVLWLRKGGELYHAAQRLLTLHEAACAADSGPLFDPLAKADGNLLYQIHMLFGMAAECWLKAILLLPEPDGHGWTLAEVTDKKHCIVDLSRECGLALTQMESRFLAFAQEAIITFGRYPCDTRGTRRSSVTARAPRAAIEGIAAKIGQLLPDSIKGQMVPSGYSTAPPTRAPKRAGGARVFTEVVGAASRR